jgi:lysophospholipase L1-like esterase
MRILRRQLFLLWVVAASSRGAGFYLHPNDVVVFYGDSITDQRLYTTYVETFVVTRYPKLPVRFVHSGWGGDHVGGGSGGAIDERLKRDVLGFKPTVMTVMLGMNDGRYQTFDEETFRVFRDGYEHIVKVMKDAIPALRITVIGPSPYDDVTRAPMFPGGYNAVLLKYGEYLRELAGRDGLDFADLNSRLVKALARANAIDPLRAQQIVPDRVHPAVGGHLLMAASLLEAWGAATTVTEVEIDAASAMVKNAVNTTVSGLESKESIRWTQKDEALPMPAPMNDAVTTLAVECSDFREKFNREILRVTGLSAPRYLLAINGHRIGVFTGEELAAGLNLAEFDTPMLQQAAQVHVLTLRRAGIHHLRWRQVQVPLENILPARVAMVDDNLDALDNDLAVIQRAAAQPVSSIYELTSVN